VNGIGEILRRDAQHIVATLGLDVSTARIEVQSLLQHLLQVNRAYLLAHAEQTLDEQQQARYTALLERRLMGEPIAYILGEREFFGLDFKVTPATLIPRADTELLVELALKKLSSPSPAPLQLAGEGKGRGQVFKVLDLGTGTGAIALSIAHVRPDVDVVAVDASVAALEVARENAQRLDIRNVTFVQSDWFSAVAGQRFDLIISNPPYIAAGDAHLAQGDVRHEPLSALASGADGLDDIRKIVGQANDFLERGAWLLLEHGYDQAGRVRELLLQKGFGEVFSEKDMAGIDRVSGGVKR
jgi:release factor glutamine methyltransferase